MEKTNRTGSLMLLLTAIIWGTAFVAQSVGMDYVGPFTFNAVRCLIGAAALVPCVFLLRKTGLVKREQHRRKDLIVGGVLCGVVMAVASSLQQFGILYTTVGKAGFITALYIVIVPVISLFLGKKSPAFIWIAVALAAVGMYFLCITEELRLGFGDLLVLLCAVCFAVHILIIDVYSPKTDGVLLSCIQFFVSGIICFVCMLLFEKPQISMILTAWKPLLYAGVMSCAVAYTLQIIGQKHVKPAVASLILSFESVVSVLAGWLILGQKLALREWFGCALVFAAILLAQKPIRPEKAKG